MTASLPPPAEKTSWGGILIAADAFLLVTGGLIYLMNTLVTERLQTMVRDAGPLAPIVVAATFTGTSLELGVSFRPAAVPAADVRAVLDRYVASLEELS